MGLEPTTSDLQSSALPLSYALSHIGVIICKMIIFIFTVCWKSAGNLNAAKIRGESF